MTSPRPLAQTSPNLAQGEPARPRPFAPTFREGRGASDPGAHSKTPDLAHTLGDIRMTTHTPSLARRTARNVAATRKARGLTQRHLADRMQALGHKILLSGISKIEQNQRTVNVEDLAALAAALGVANPWDLTGDICETCSSAPPAGFRCVTCDREGATA